MAESHFDHGDLPERAALNLRCPSLRHDAVAATVAPVPGSGYRAQFRCERCGLVFTISDAQLRAKVA